MPGSVQNPAVATIVPASLCRAVPRRQEPLGSKGEAGFLPFVSS
jgi:hypothetical protein